MAVTDQEVRDELKLRQLTMTDRMLRSIMAKVEALQPCFDRHGYSEDDVFLITVYICSLIATVNGSDGRIKSQSAPSGASRSFEFGSMSDRWNSLVNLLKGVDPYGCTVKLVPRDPSKKARCALFVSPGVPL